MDLGSLNRRSWILHTNKQSLNNVLYSLQIFSKSLTSKIFRKYHVDLLFNHFFRQWTTVFRLISITSFLSAPERFNFVTLKYSSTANEKVKSVSFVFPHTTSQALYFTYFPFSSIFKLRTTLYGTIRVPRVIWTVSCIFVCCEFFWLSARAIFELSISLEQSASSTIAVSI